MSVIVNPFASSGGDLLVTGNSTVTTGINPKSGIPITSTATGFGNAQPTYGSYGSLVTQLYAGFPIVAIYNIGSGDTAMQVMGDARGHSPVLKVDGADQHLGAASYNSSSGLTTFTGTVANAFTGTHNISLM